MKVAEAVARVLKEEGIEYLICYPRQALIDFCAEIGIKPIVCRQERVGVGIADGISRSTYGKRTGVFSMQGGPGVENTFPGAAQVFGDNVPVLLIPGDRVGRSFTPPSFDPVQNFRPVMKWARKSVSRAIELMRRAFNNLARASPTGADRAAPAGRQQRIPGEFSTRHQMHPHGARSRRRPHHADVAQCEAAHHPCWQGVTLLRCHQRAGQACRARTGTGSHNEHRQGGFSRKPPAFAGCLGRLGAKDDVSLPEERRLRRRYGLEPHAQSLGASNSTRQNHSSLHK